MGAFLLFAEQGGKEILAFSAILEYNKLNYYLFVRAPVKTPLLQFG